MNTIYGQWVLGRPSGQGGTLTSDREGTYRRIDGQLTNPAGGAVGVGAAGGRWATSSAVAREALDAMSQGAAKVATLPRGSFLTRHTFDLTTMEHGDVTNALRAFARTSSQNAAAVRGKAFQRVDVIEFEDSQRRFVLLGGRAGQLCLELPSAP